MKRSMICIAAGLVLAAGAPLAFAAKTVAWLEIKGGLAEMPEPFAALKGPDAAPTLRQMVGALNAAAKDPNVAGLVLRLREAEIDRAQAEELGAALAALHAAGKKSYVFSEAYGPTELLLAAHADEIVVQSGGSVSLPGLYMEEMFLADSLALLGVKADFVQIGAYKGAKEQLANSAPSPEWDSNINGLLDTLYATTRAQIGSGRHLNDAALDAAMKEAFLANPETAIKLGLIDKAMDRVDLEEYLASVYGEDYETAVGYGLPSEAAADTSNVFALMEAFSNPPSHEPTRDTIAVLHIDGAIGDGESKPGGALSGSEVGALTIRKALREIEDDDHIKGVIVRIDSPGGSASASESIWLGLRRIAKDRPVWTSVGGMAASGGYYIAVAGDKVYVNPSSIVGSIGVVGGKIALGGLFDLLKVHVVPRTRGPGGAMMGSISPWTDSERALVSKRMTETYDLFVDRVSKGRKGIDISKTAEGRLFAGQKAIDMKMADALGGLSDATGALAAQLGLKEGQYDVLDYPPPPTLAEAVQDLLERLPGVGASAPGVGAESSVSGAALGAIREAVGPKAWPQVRDAIGALMKMRDEPVLLTAPRVILVK